MGLDGPQLTATVPVRVLIVDDTRTVRALLRAHLSTDPRLSVVGEAGDPYEAREKIKALNPDVVTLDVEMPKMNGLEFLKKLMRLRPMPVVMISTRTTEQSDVAVRALSLGAVDCIDLRVLQGVGPGEVQLADTLIMASKAKLSMPGRPAAHDPGSFDWNGKCVVIGSSTGGVDALMTVIGGYPAHGPPTLIAQHMPAAFLQSFCARLDRKTRPRVTLAQDGQTLEQGHVYLAPGGDRHLAIGGRKVTRLRVVQDTGRETYIPSVNVLFNSALPIAPSVVAVMLTGMGRDGADAMKALRDQGAHTIVQSGETAVVDGMPRAAREAGAACEVAALGEVSKHILAATKRAREAGR